MNPVFEVEGVPVALHPMAMVSVAMDQLGEHAESLADLGQIIADALDSMCTARPSSGSSPRPAPHPSFLHSVPRA